ncbi:MAG: FtsB family cell division protein [Pleomorphochaeta sp.]
MTIKLIKIFIISTLLTYITLIFVASDIGIIQYQHLKSNNLEEKRINLQLEQEINELEKEIENLEEQGQVLDLAYELGYVNSGDEVYIVNETDNTNLVNNKEYEIKSNINLNKSVFTGWKNYQFFIFSILIGIAITVCYLLISKKRR